MDKRDFSRAWVVIGTGNECRVKNERSGESFYPLPLEAALPLAEKLTKQDNQIAILKQELTQATHNNHTRNIQLDALHFVWCDGGCRFGTHRYTEGEVTEDIVQAAERNTLRLRKWFTNSVSRKEQEVSR